MGKCKLCDTATKGASDLCAECEILRSEIKNRGRDLVLQTVRTTLSDDTQTPTRDAPRHASSSKVRRGSHPSLNKLQLIKKIHQVSVFKSIYSS